MSVVATGIHNKKQIDTEIYSYKTDESEAKLENTPMQEYSNDLEGSNNQIDLETQINELGTDEKFFQKEDIYNNELNKANLSSLYESKDELNLILDKKPNNQLTETKSKTLFNRFSSFFINDKSEEIKLEPSLKGENKPIYEKKLADMNVDQQDKEEISIKTDNNFDLFSSENQDTIDKHQINLTEIEQETKDVDETVLEIPAFLRRQAN